MEKIKLLIEHYNNSGVKLWTDNGQLHFKAPAGSLTNEDKRILKENKADIIKYLSDLECKKVIHNEKDAFEPFILTPIQSSYLLGRNSIYDYGGTGCHAYVEIKLAPRCAVERVENAWHKVILRHDMLRAVVEKEGVQRVLENVELPEVKELYASGNEYKKLFHDTRKEMSNKKYSSDIYPLHELRVTSSDDFSILHFSMDMLIADSISAGIILSDILSFYYNPDKDISKPEITFRDVVIYNQSRNSTIKYQMKYNKDMKYWKDRADSLPEEPKIPLLANGKGRYEAKFNQLEFSLDNYEWESLKGFAMRKKITGSSAVLAVFAEILCSWSSNEHFCINTTTMNRPAIHKQIYDVVGDFTNINLLEIERIRSDSFAESAVKIHTQLWNDLEHSDFNGIDVMHFLNRQRKKQISMPYVYTSTIGIKGLEDSRINVVYKESQTPQVFIDCQVSENKNGLSVIWCVRDNVFKKGIAEKMFEQFGILLKTIANDFSVWDNNYPCVSNERAYYNNMFVSKDGIHQCFENVIGKVYDCDGNDMNILGRYNSDGEIDILGNSENTIQYKGNTIYLDYCRDKIKNSLDAKDVYIRKNNSSADVYILANDIEKGSTAVFDMERFNSEAFKNIDRNMLSKEIDISNEYSIIEIINLFQSFGIFNENTEGYSFDDIKEKLNIKPEYSLLVKRWLNALKKEKYIHESDGIYHAVKTDNSERYSKLGDELTHLISEDESIKSMAEYILNSRNSLKEIITGKKSPLDVFFPEGSDETAFSTYNESFIADTMNKAVAYTAEKISAEIKGRKIRIIEVGAGVGGTTDEILKVLDKYSDIEYYFTDISNYFLKLSSSRFNKYDWIKYGIFDINKSCWEQNIDIGSFDIIIASNVFHNAKDGNVSMNILKEIMSPNGYMIFLDAVDEPYSLMISKSILHNEEILDSRASDNRIFFSDEEWKNMFNKNELSVEMDYPDDMLMKKAQLKMYVVKNSKFYTDIKADDIFNAVSDEVGFKEVFSKIINSQLLPVNDDCCIDTVLLEEKLNCSDSDNAIGEERYLPSNETEQKIFDIWKNILENDAISINDNFFEAGGDSLLASMMITDIRKNISKAESFEWEKLMQIVLQNPTIRDIANILDSTETANDFCIEYQHGLDTPSQVWVLFVNGTGTMAIYNQLLQIMKFNISSDDRIIGLHCGNFDNYIKMPYEKTINILADRNTQLLENIKAERYNLIGHCFGGGVAIQTAVNLAGKNITNISVTTIDTRRWNVFCDNPLIIERGFGEMMKSDVSKCGHTASDKILQRNLEYFIKKYGRLMTTDELCTSDEIDSELKECYSKIKDIPQDERLSMMFRQTNIPQTEEQEKQFIMLYKVFYHCLNSFTAFKPDFYSGEVHAVRCNDRSNFFIPVESADESDYIKESVTGKVNNYYIDGDHFTCLLDDNNVKAVAEIILKNKE